MTITHPVVSRRSQALNGGLWSAAGQILPAVGTAALSVAAGRYLGSGPLGRQSLIAYVNAAAASAVLVSLRTALLQLGGRLQGQGDDARLRRLVRWSLPAHLVAALLVVGVLMISALLTGQDLLAWSVVAGVAVFDAAAYGLSVGMILAEGWGGVGRLRLVSQLIGPPLGILFLFLGYGIAGMFLGDGLAAVGLLIAMLVRRRRRMPSPGAAGFGVRPPVPVLRPYVLFSVSAVITQIVSKRVEFIVLAIFAGDVAIGMYSVAFMAVNLVAMIPLGVATAALPMVAAADARGESGLAARHLKFAVRIGTTLLIPMVTLLAVLGPAAVTVVYGSAYAAAARLVPLASAGLLMTVVIGLCSQFWSGRGQLGLVLGTGAVAAVVDVAVAFALVPSHGALGAVLANLAGQLTLGAGLLHATTQRLGAVGWRAPALARSALVAVAAAAAVLIIELAAATVFASTLRALVTLLLGGPVGVLVAGLLARRGGLLDVEELDWLRPMLPARQRPARVED